MKSMKILILVELLLILIMLSMLGGCVENNPTKIVKQIENEDDEVDIEVDDPHLTFVVGNDVKYDPFNDAFSLIGIGKITIDHHGIEYGIEIEEYTFDEGEDKFMGFPLYPFPHTVRISGIITHFRMGLYMTELDVTNSPALRYLDLSGGQLKDLDLSINHKLTELDIRGNMLSASGLNNLFHTLPVNKKNKTIRIIGNPGASECDPNIAKEKGWKVPDFVEKSGNIYMAHWTTWTWCTIIGKGEITVVWGDGSSEKHVFQDGENEKHTFSKSINDPPCIRVFGEVISLSTPGMYELDITNCPSLEYLSCTPARSDWGYLKQIDLSKNTQIKTLLLYSNRISSIDVSNLKLLETLVCSSNLLTELDLSQNPLLKDVACMTNKLSSTGLDNLFHSLHEYEFQKTVYIVENPGSKDCDTSIATKKGWTVSNH